MTPKPAYVAAETAWRMMTQRDPYVNMLRTTIAIAAAGLGGADSIAVLPHTAALGLPDAFARRIARNTQLILLEESNLFRVADPAAGSGAIEDLTSKLCAAAWAQFQEIEKAGGVWTALESGIVQKNVAAVRAEREKAIARRKDALTGTSDFPNLQEAPAAVLDVAKVAAPKESAAAVTAEPLPRIRLAEPFEALRDAVRRDPRKDRRAAESVPGQSRQAVGVHRARHVREEFLRGRRHRGGRQRRLQGPGRIDRGVQGVGRQARLPVLVGQGL